MIKRFRFCYDAALGHAYQADSAKGYTCASHGNEERDFVLASDHEPVVNLLAEVRKERDLIGFRPINEYKDGKVQASGRFEYFCWHCSADPAPDFMEIKHEAHCLLARIDALLSSQSDAGAKS